MLVKGFVTATHERRIQTCQVKKKERPCKFVKNRAKFDHDYVRADVTAFRTMVDERLGLGQSKQTKINKYGYQFRALFALSDANRSLRKVRAYHNSLWTKKV